MEAGAWTWLEVAKLLASLSIPMALLLLGLALERRKIANQELTKKRIAVYDVVAPRLNDIFCFFTAVGHWRDLDPAKIIEKKREVDRQMHIYRVMYSSNLMETYNAFMDSAFTMFSGVGLPARLRMDRDFIGSQIGSAWNTEWTASLDTENPTPVSEFRTRYHALMDTFAREIGVD